MRRTQLYLDEDLWNTLRARARGERTTVSDLVREAIRERYLGKQDERRKAMQSFVGLRRNHLEVRDSEALVRKLRRGSRIERLAKA